MASRSNTGLHVAVILLIFLVVILGITTYVFYTRADSSYNAEQAAVSRADNEAKRANNLNFAYNLLLVTVGESTLAPVELDTMRNELKSSDPKLSDQIEKIENRFTEDMKLFPAGYADTKAYPQLPQELYKMVKARDAQIADYEQREREYIAERDQIKQDAQKRVEAAEAAQQAAEEAKSQLALRHDQQYNEITTKNKALQDKVDADFTAYKENLTLKDKQIKQLDTENLGLQNTIDQQKNELDDRNKTSFDHPYAKIVSVRQGTPRMVVINLGLADGLRRQQTFSIYDQGEGDLINAKPKGSIEVMSVSDPHLAQARILDDELSNPILPGDLVFSPTWQPGQRLHFALAGLLDYDGDGRSDAAIIKNAITYNGGVIDAEVDENGKMTGSVTIKTRYLVLGERPTEKSSDAATQNFTKLTAEASKYGIEAISVDKLLSMMGFRPDVHTQNLAAPTPEAAGKDGSKFRRRPSDAYGP